MYTRRGGRDDGTALCPGPLSASCRFSSPSFQKENSNSNPRRSTSHKNLPRGRNSNPSDLPCSLSTQKPTLDLTPTLPLNPSASPNPA
ncbi:hypothetical protein Fmac_008181 [Flemingia macrophylla]|uniref:Uncharacterized protein n=1 Tax=Flemingia macrophylla TaxID=520843 RepID=A0ABD1MWP2_9FABA